MKMYSSSFMQKERGATISLVCILFLIPGFFMNPVIAQESNSPLVVVAPVKMNVFYVGVDNPVAVAVSGYNSDELAVSVTNGKIKGEKGRYIFCPEQPGTSVITVSAKGKVLGSSEFRDKLIPTPVAKVCGMRGGLVLKESLIREKGIVVEIENFDFEVNCNVTSFMVSCKDPTSPGFSMDKEDSGKDVELKSNGPEFTAEQKAILAKLLPGQKVYFENIQALLPDGTIREMGSVILRIQ